MSLRRFVSSIVVVIAGLALSAVTAFADPLTTTDSKDATKTAPQVIPASISTPAPQADSPLEPAKGGKSSPTIPEPATAILVGIALLGAGTMARRRKAREA